MMLEVTKNNTSIFKTDNLIGKIEENLWTKHLSSLPISASSANYYYYLNSDHVPTIII